MGYEMDIIMAAAQAADGKFAEALEMLKLAKGAGMNVTHQMIQEKSKMRRSRKGRKDLQAILGKTGGASESGLDDPMLANVAIDGWIVILNKPTEPEPAALPDQSPGAPQSPAAVEGIAVEKPGAAPAAATAETAIETETDAALESQPSDSAAPAEEPSSEEPAENER